LGSAVLAALLRFGFGIRGPRFLVAETGHLENSPATRNRILDIAGFLEMTSNGFRRPGRLVGTEFFHKSVEFFPESFSLFSDIFCFLYDR